MQPQLGTDASRCASMVALQTPAGNQTGVPVLSGMCGKELELAYFITGKS